MEEALAQGTDVVFRLDIQGAHTIRRKFPDALTIFLVCRSTCCMHVVCERHGMHWSASTGHCASTLGQQAHRAEDTLTG